MYKSRNIKFSRTAIDTRKTKKGESYENSSIIIIVCPGKN